MRIKGEFEIYVEDRNTIIGDICKAIEGIDKSVVFVNHSISIIHDKGEN